MKKALLALFLVAAGLVAAQYLIYLPMQKQRLAASAAEWEAEKAAKSTRETARIYAQVLAEAEQEKRQAAEAERLRAELQEITERYHAQQAAFAAEQRRLAEIAERARIERETELMARRYAAQRSNPASVENLRAQGVPRWFYESEQPRRPAPEIRVHVEPDPGHYQINETVPGFFTVRPR